MPPTLIGSWSELSTGRPDLRPGIQRCFLFREDSSYVQDDILPDTTPPAPVPQGLLRWQGTISVVAGDTLERTLDFQDIYHQDADTLKAVYHDELLGSFDARMTIGSNTLDLDYTLWVQGEGFVAIHDTYSRGTAGSCGATL
jgi:hypothetical protein